MASTLGQCGAIGFGVSDTAQSVGHADGPHDTNQFVGEHHARIIGFGIDDVTGQQSGSLQMAVRARRRDGPEYRGRVDDNRHAVRHQRLRARVARRVEIPYLAGDRIRHRVRDVHSGIAERDAGKGGRPHRLLTRLAVGRIVDRALEMPPSSRSASRQPRSLHGFAPWLMGRRFGGSDTARRVWGRAVYDSRAWDNTSSPLHATTSPGKLSVQSGSMSASVGRSAGDAMPVFASIARRSKIAIPVTSLPVPEVVGHAMCGVSGPGTGSPSPTGLLT